MQRLYSPAAISVLALCLAFAAPAAAQPAAAPAPQAADAAAGSGAQAAAPAPRQVSARELLTPQERSEFRRQIRAAAPEERQRLWAQKRAELEQRAAQRGVVLAAPGAGRPGQKTAEAGRGEGRGPATPQPPRAP